MNPSRFRMIEWLIATIVLLILLYLVHPADIKVLITKVTMVALFATGGYWFDRRIAPNVRPNNPDLTPQERGAAGLRRAIVIAAFVIAGSLGA